MSKAFYRKYRSKKLSEVVGQRHITDILARAIKNGKVAHAYLFTGPRGVGKTSVARILAHEVNGLAYDDDSSHLDIIEIDAASNNGVDDIRDLRERVQLAPVSADKKVYIIDEAHMLSKPAFNALLKTLEEPPEHVVFVLATTDADKLPTTIISRTQRFTFRTISMSDVADHLGWIAEQEGFKAERDALELIAIHGGGSFRDSIGLLDQLHGAVDKKIGLTRQLVETFLGLPPTELVDNLLASHRAGDLAKTSSLLSKAEQAGAQPAVIATELIRVIRPIIADNPQLLPLLDDLMEVASSSRPDIKLLTALASSSVVSVPVKPKTVALAAPSPTIELPVPAKKTTPKKTAAPAKPTKPVTKAEPTSFDWSKLLTHIQQNFIAIHAVLAKSTPKLEGETLTLYTSNAFYKKKLDDIRYRTNIMASLDSLGMSGLTIETIGTPPPPEDIVAASVAAIMGGGEEFNITETESN